MGNPEFLYRGVSVEAKEFLKLELWGDIKPISPPTKNAEGKYVVADGNEYGIYMTTSYSMAKDVYGNTHASGGVYNPEITYVDGGMRHQLRYPKLGMVYKINTKNLPIKKPWISQVLKGHYNNGYEGEEWITQSENPDGHIIPKENYVVTNVVLGYDLLNEKQNVDISGLAEAQIKERITEMLEKRKLGFELFLNQVKKHPVNLRNVRIKLKMPIYKKLFNSKDGIAFTDYSKVDVNDINQVVNHLMQRIYNRDKENIDISTLDKIYSLSVRAKTTEQFEKLVNKKIEELEIKLEKVNLQNAARDNINKELKMWKSVEKFLEAQYSNEKVNNSL